MNFRIVSLLVLLAIASTATAVMMNQNAPSIDETDGKIPVALYIDTWSHPPQSYTAMLEAAGCNVTVINADKDFKATKAAR